MSSKEGYIVNKGIIVIDRDLTDLDKFVKSFLDILKKYTGYLVVSGYVSICSGRSRGTEDVDIIIPIMDFDKFNQLFEDLQKNNFWCYQGDTPGGTYEYVKTQSSIRFAAKDTLFPNIELIPFNKTKKAKSFEFEHPQEIIISGFEFKIPQIEFEILYKEIVLKGKKDLEDAKHLRSFFSGILRKEKFLEYEAIVRSELK